MSSLIIGKGQVLIHSRTVDAVAVGEGIAKMNTFWLERSVCEEDIAGTRMPCFGWMVVEVKKLEWSNAK